jgi:LEA14-like dessication related protein
MITRQPRGSGAAPDQKAFSQGFHHWNPSRSSGGIAGKKAEAMRRNVIWPYALWMVLFAAAVSGCAPVFWRGEKPRIDIVSIAPKEMRLMEQTFLMELRILNTTERDLNITGVVFDLEINGQPFATGVSNQSLTVERLSTKTVKIEAYSGLTSILRQLSELGKGGFDSGLKYRLKGSLYSGAPFFRIPFNETGEFK